MHCRPAPATHPEHFPYNVPRMDTTKIAELLHPFVPNAPLSESLLEKISTYIDLLLRWNARVNLSAIRDSETIVTRHFGESLFTARHLFPEISSPLKDDVSPSRDEVSPPQDSSAEECGRAALQGRVRSTETEGALAPVPQAAERRQNAAHGASRGEDTTLYPAAEQRKKITLADVGSGAGFPGVPIKL